MPKFLVGIVEWFLTTNFWVKIARHHIAYFTFRTFGYPKFPMERYFEILKILQDNPDKRYGFVAADKDSLSWKLTHMMTKAKWGHAGVLYLENDQVRASHMKGDGLNDWHVLDILRESDKFAVLELGLSGNSRNAYDRRFEFARTSAKASLKYDFTMSLSTHVFGWLDDGGLHDADKSYVLYCSEYLYALCEGLSPSIKAEEFNGRLLFEPDDAYKCCKVVFEQ